VQLLGELGDRAYGQFCIVWPQEDAVIVTTGRPPTCKRCST
jgi:hypothetical protein